ncbi:MAG: hypothetical protein L0Y56_14760 [Nitrospira sp.]|nr:hypothetical protein [Nitrospira sp.]
MASIDSGKWSVDDVLEMQVDELSTSASVGSGPDRPIGRGDKDTLVKLQRAYEEYLAKTRTEASAKSAKTFVLEATPGATSTLIKGFVEHLRTEGFRV